MLAIKLQKVLVTSFNVLHNYFDDLKLFSDLYN